MADIRRQSTDGRVATPKIGSQVMTDLDATLTKIIGARVRLSTTATSSSSADAMEGTVFAACPLTNLIAVNTAPPPPNPSSTITNQPGDYHVIPVSRIQSFQLVGLATDPLSKGEESGGGGGFDSAVPSIGRVDIKALEAREQATIARIKEKEASKGRGVTKEAQEIFDALARTLPARWHDTSIVINDAVIISKPYTVEDCAAPKDQHNALSRVKKVLEHERKKIADRTGKSSTVTAGMRKGG